MRAPLEECEAAGAVRAVGGWAFVIDGPAESLTSERFENRLRKLNPDLVVIVTTFGTLELDLQWAKRIKEVLPHVPAGVRGAPCYTHDREILNRIPEVDFCVRGEYEIVFESIARSGYIGTPGVSYRGADGGVVVGPAPRAADLDSLPLPDRSAVNSKLYKVRGLRAFQATIRVQRGCPFPCSYCLVHTVSGDTARHRSAPHIAAEMKSLMEQGISCFYLRADTFSLDRSWTLKLCETLARDCPGAQWVTTTRVDRVDEEVIQAMARGGCYGISFGLDVASKTIAKKVHKYAEVDKAISAFRACDRAGIVSLAYIMIGFIWESEDTLAETDRFLSAIRPDLLTIHFAHPYPGTKYYAEVSRLGAEILSLRAQAEPALHASGVSASELKRVARRWLRRHYTRPIVVARLMIKGTRLLYRRVLVFGQRLKRILAGTLAGES